MDHIMSLVHGHSHDNQPDYRPQDEPPLFNRLLAAGLVVIALAIWLIATLSQGQRLLAYGVLAVGVLLVLPKTMLKTFLWRYAPRRYRVREALIAYVRWTGAENVLDVGTGNGILLTGCAKQLTTGKAAGIDVWEPHSGGGDESNFWRNVQAEGVTDRVELHNMNARQMTFPDESFEVVMSSMALHHIGPNAETLDQAVREMWRVLKPGGTIALFDAGPIINASLERLRQYGIINLHQDGKVMKFIIGRKPA